VGRRSVALAAAALVASLLLGGTGCGGGGLSSPRTGVVIVNTDRGSGSGIVLSRSGLVLTNDHVIRGTKAIQVDDPS
jgi:S1-C subfamily serine protease